MFPDQPYYVVNREERHFGFLFMAALATDSGTRDRLIDYINSVIGHDLDPRRIDVYAEVCLFRDYWRALGNPSRYSKETHEARLQIFRAMLGVMDVDAKIVDTDPVFWTGRPGDSKLFYPGKWSKEKINSAEIMYGLTEKQLWRLRWACNAKPDAMIEDPESIVFIEIKVESDFGSSENGYDQLQTQQDILQLGKAVIPPLSQKETQLTTLTIDGPDLNWSEIARILGESTSGAYEMVKRHLEAMPK